jgi:hypothetical protein
MSRQIIAVLLVLSGSAHAAEATKETIVLPAIGAVAQATAGSQIFERTGGSRYPAVRLEAPVAYKYGLFPTIDLPSGTILAIDLDRKKLRACLHPNASGPCLIDTDLDGKFDQMNDWLGYAARKVPEPAPYSRGASILAEDASDGFSQRLIYLGMAGQTLRLSYREFINDMARPAFTEEVTFTLSGKYPETVAYKDLSIDILGVDNAGLRYVIRKAGN